MSILNRIAKVATGVGGALQAPLGLVKDLATAPFVDDAEHDGFVNVLYGRTVARGGQLLGNLLGPQEGLGAVIGGLPQTGVRDPGRAVIHPILSGIETAGREGIREPLAAAVTAASLADRPGGGGLGGLFRGENWRQGYKIAQHRSLGQAVALALGTKDILDETEVAKAVGTDRYKAISGTFDGLTRLFLSPDIMTLEATRIARFAPLAGNIAKTGKLTNALDRAIVGGITKTSQAAFPRLAEKGILARTIRSADDVEAALAHPALPLVNEKIAQIKEEAGLGRPVEPPAVPAGAAADAVSPVATAARSMAEIDAEIKDLVSRTGSEDISAAEFDRLNARLKEVRAEKAGGAAAAGERVPTATVTQPDIWEPPLALKAGEPGIRMEEVTQGARRGKYVVHRNAAGDVDGYLQIAINPHTGLPGSLDVMVHQAARRQGIGTELYRVATEAGYDVEAISGAGGMTVAGEAFAQGRRAKAAAEGAAAATGLSAVERAAAVDKAAARIRDLAFHNHAFGEPIARILAEADDPNLVWPALMGDANALSVLVEHNAALEGQISRLVGQQAELAQWARARPGQLPFQLEQARAGLVENELEQLYQVQERTQRALETFNTIKQMPRISALSETRSAIVRHDFFQDSIFAAPMRLATTMNPHRLVGLHEANGDIQVARFAKKGELALEEQDRFRGAYMAATDPTARQVVLDELQAAVVKNLAEKHGVSPDQIQKYIDSAGRFSKDAHAKLAESHVYDAEAKFSKIKLIDEDGTTHQTNLPGAVTQEFNHYALPNLDRLDTVMKRAARLDSKAMRGAYAGADALTSVMDDFYKIWKPSVLIRAGWPIRVVLEEQLRIMTKLGVLTTAGRTGKAVYRYGRDGASDIITEAGEILGRVPKSMRRSADPLESITRGQEIGTMEVRNWPMQRAFGAPGDVKEVIIKQNRSADTFTAMVAGAEEQTLRDLRATASGEWKTIPAHDISHGPAWTHAVNNQIGKDAMWRQFLEGKSVAQVEDWIRTVEGQKYLRRVPHWKNNVEEWLTAAKDVADSYVPTAELRAKALAGEATVDDLVRAIPNAADRPSVHGAILNEVQGKGFLRQKLTDFRDGAMKMLGQMPTDIASRHPFFDAVYNSHVTETVNLLADQGVAFTPQLAKTIEAQARRFALNESKLLLYDLAEQSELAGMLRFVSPFYSAWGEVLTRWTGIASENPAFVARMQQVWHAPERAGIVTDENGNRLHDDGTATDHQGNKVEPGKEHYVTIGIPKFAINDLTRHIPGVKGLETMGAVRFNKDGFNTILQGAPGVGPLVQIPLNEIVKDRPELEASMKFVLPFGTTQNTMDLIMPATAKRMKTLSAGDEDRVYRNTLMRIYYDGITDYNLGKRSAQPTYAEAKKKTDAFYSMRVIASFVSPVAPNFSSPYQLHIDVYRALRAADQGKDRNAPGYKSPDQLFLDQFGADYFALTQSLSKSMDGVPPTIEAYQTRKEYKDIIEAHPDLGGLIIGAEGAGEFNRAVYDSQLQEKVAPGSADFQRSSPSFEEAQAAPDIRLGWIEYQKYMDLLEAERIQQGLPNFRVKAAQGLADIKRQITARLGEKYPEWYQQFSTVDRTAMDRRLTGMRAIAADKRLSGRDDIAGLGHYLRYRDFVTTELAKRKAAGGSGTLDSRENADLDGTWEQIKSALVEKNLAFSSLYYRYLEHDNLAA